MGQLSFGGRLAARHFAADDRADLYFLNTNLPIEPRYPLIVSFISTSPVFTSFLCFIFMRTPTSGGRQWAKTVILAETCLSSPFHLAFMGKTTPICGGHCPEPPGRFTWKQKCLLLKRIGSYASRALSVTTRRPHRMRPIEMKNGSAAEYRMTLIVASCMALP